MQAVTVVGYLATICSTTSFTPQAWKIIKTRDTSSISMPMYAITVLGFALWLAFGIMKAEWPIIITNGVCLVLAAFILTMTALPRAQKDAVADVFDKRTSDSLNSYGSNGYHQVGQPWWRRWMMKIVSREAARPATQGSALRGSHDPYRNA